MPKPQAPEGADVTTGELARALGVTSAAVRLWIDEKRLVPDAWTLGGHARFTERTKARLVARLRKGRPKAA